MSKLVLVHGNCNQTEIALTKQISLGRGISNDLKILDHNVSRKHALIENREGKFFIKDLLSTNGTIVNGLLIKEKVLSEGDQIKIGDCIFLFEKDNTQIFFPNYQNQLLQIVDDDENNSNVDIDMELETRNIKIFDDKILSKKPRELIKAYRKLSILFEIGKTLGTQSQIAPLLSKILESIFKIIPAQRGFILKIDPYTYDVIPLIVKKLETNKFKKTISISNKILNYVNKNRKGILTTEPLENNKPNINIRTVICAPLFIKDTMFGYIWIDTENRNTVISSDDLELITAIAQQTSLALENIKLTDDRIRTERLSAIGEMVSSVVHEIKNPLSSIQIYTELLQDLHHDKDQTEYTDVILSEITRLLDTTNQILDYGQTITLITQLEDVTFLIDEVLKILEQQARLKNIKLIKKYKKSLPQVPIDHDRLKQVIFNIALNAIQMTPDNGNVIVSIALLPQKKYFRISIADNGPGIQPALKEQIFQPFFSNRRGGSGLGLSISQRIIEEHGGRIQVDSDGKKGACFHIELPLNEDSNNL